MTAAPLSITEAARRMGVGKDALYAAIKANECPLPVIKVGRSMRIPAPQVDFWITFGRVAEAGELLEFVKASA